MTAYKGDAEEIKRRARRNRLRFCQDVIDAFESAHGRKAVTMKELEEWLETDKGQAAIGE
jgi:hypothetical protein